MSAVSDVMHAAADALYAQAGYLEYGERTPDELVAIADALRAAAPALPPAPHPRDVERGDEVGG